MRFGSSCVLDDSKYGSSTRSNLADLLSILVRPERHTNKSHEILAEANELLLQRLKLCVLCSFALDVHSELQSLLEHRALASVAYQPFSFLLEGDAFL